MSVFGRGVFALCLLTAVAGAASAQSVRVLGRSLSDGRGGFTIAWPNSGFETAFTGARLRVTLGDSGKNRFDVEVDGKTSRIDLKPGVNTYTLFEGAEASHLLRFTRRTNGLSGDTHITAIKSDGRLEALHPSDRRMLVIGDSIASGYGVEGANQYCSFSLETENASLGFAALAAGALKADLENVSLDGRGLYRNYGGEGGPTMAELSWRTLPGNPARWPATAPSPQVVVVNLGVNDFAQGEPGPGFGPAYVSFLRDLRGAYPSAWIFGTFGAMLSGANYDAALSAVSTAVSARRTAGDLRVEFLEFRPPDGPNRFGCDWHPGRAAQQDMAQTLQRAILHAGAWAN
jgi:lysophospholipase L1-like esterase